jgi:dipeptidyl aminopeptidase/acylaminoacyl peptidase
MTYAGPHTPTIRDTFGGGNVADQAKAKEGYVVFRCDPRSASPRGAVSTWTAYRRLGIQEMKDIDTAINWLIKQGYVDAKRIGMSGHSYGGFMTAFALTHSKLFAAGIAGSPVTDWRNYDTIYTERYMDTPQNNPEGYEATSVVKAAKNIHGRLLLIHGMMDDNVHVANTLQLVDELQKANKDFEVMVYPRARHGIFGPHYQRLMNDFMRRTLRPDRVVWREEGQK